MFEQLFVGQGKEVPPLSDRFQNCLDAVVQVEPLIDFTDPLWMFDHVIIDDCGEDAETVEPVVPVQRRKRKPSVSSIIRQMQRAGVEVAGCKVNPRDGTVMVVSGKPSETPDINNTDTDTDTDTDNNDWDGVLLQ